MTVTLKIGAYFQKYKISNIFNFKNIFLVSVLMEYAARAVLYKCTLMSSCNKNKLYQ